MTDQSNVYLKPVIHDTRNEPQRVTFTDAHVMVELADGRIIGVPLHFFPLLEAASDDQRRNYQLGSCSIYWEDIDDGIDLKAMLSGLYLETREEYRQRLEEIVDERKVKATTT